MTNKSKQQSILKQLSNARRVIGKNFKYMNSVHLNIIKGLSKKEEAILERHLKNILIGHYTLNKTVCKYGKELATIIKSRGPKP